MECVSAAEAARTGSTCDDVFGGLADVVAYSAEAAAASWKGTEQHSTPVPKLFLGDMIKKVLKQVDPDIKISKAGQKVVSDLIACVVDAVLAAVDGLPASASSDQFATVHTNAFIENESAKKVLASRLMPRDEVLVHHADKDEGGCSWELRNEVVRVGLAGALASFEAKTAAEQEAVFNKAQQDLPTSSTSPGVAGRFVRCPRARYFNPIILDLGPDDGVTTPSAVQAAVRRVFSGELARHAVNEGTKAVFKFSCRDMPNGPARGSAPAIGGVTAAGGGGVAAADHTAVGPAPPTDLNAVQRTAAPQPVRIPCVSFNDGKMQYNGNLTAASDININDVNSAISIAAGLQVSVLEIAHVMHARLGSPPSLTAAVYLAAAVEYLVAEILELSGKEARDCKSSWIQPRNLQLALTKDAELNKMVDNVSILDGGVVPHVHAVLLPNASASKDEAVETMQAYFTMRNDNNEVIHTNYFVSGTRPSGFHCCFSEGVEVLSVGAAWVCACIADEEGGVPLHGAFTTLSKEDQAALLKPSREKAEDVKEGWGAKAGNGAKRQKLVGVGQHRKILRESIQGITNDMILALAARAGCLMLSADMFEETRGLLKVFLEDLIRDAVTITTYKKRKVVLATDVLAAAAAPGENTTRKVVCGTGRVAPMYATSVGASNSGGGTPSAFAKLAAEYSAKLARGQDAGGDDDGDADALLDMCNADGFNEAVTSAWEADLDKEVGYGTSSAKDLDDVYGGISCAEGAFDVYAVDQYDYPRHPSGVPFLSREEVNADPMQVHKDALRYIRQMQQSSGPCLPFMPFSLLVHEIVQDLGLDLEFEPEAFRVMRSMLETYLVGLFRDANLNCIHGGGSSHRTFPFAGFDAENPQLEKRSFAITPTDMQLARRNQNERA